MYHRKKEMEYNGKGSTIQREINKFKERERELLFDDKKNVTHHYDDNLYNTLKKFIGKLTKAS